MRWVTQTQQGFLIVAVALILGVMAVTALMLSNVAASDNASVAQHKEDVDLDYLAESAVEHAKWRLAQTTACTGYSDLPATQFGLHSYSASFTPTSGSPVAVSAQATLATGAVRTLSRTDARAYQAPINIVLQPGPEGQDAEIWDQAPNTNYGAAEETWVSSASNDTTRSLFRFDVSKIPSGVRILQADLSLDRWSGSGSDQPVSAHRITNSWRENSVSWNEREAGTDWAAPGSDYDSTAVATALLGPSNGRYEWRISQLVQGWVEGLFPNDGVVLVAAVPGIAGHRFYTSEESLASRRPILTIRYACECGLVCTPPISAVAYRDEFSVLACRKGDYQGSNGTLDWSGESWEETTDDDDSCGGDVRLMDDPLLEAGNHRLHFNSNDEILRPVDLSMFESAYLHFDYRRDNISATGRLLVEIKNAAGSWVEVGRITGPATDADYQRAHFNITGQISAKAEIRLTTSSLTSSNHLYLDNFQVDEDGSAFIPPDGIAHWKFDETSGKLASDSVGRNDGTLVNDPAWQAGGRVDGALKFDGSEDHVHIAHADELSLTSSFTISAWVYSENLSGSHRIISKEASGANDGYFIAAQAQTLFVGIGGSFFNAGSIAEDEWQHITVVLDVDADRLTVYVNGVEQLAQSTTASVNVNAATVYIGANWQGKYWSGLLDDVRLFGEVLTVEQIGTLAGVDGNNGSGGADGGADSSCDVVVRDEFNTQNYAGSDADDLWESDWEEFGDSGSPTSQDERVVEEGGGFKLQIADNDNGGFGGSGEGVWREVDLSEMSRARLSYKYQREGLDNANDSASLFVSSDGGDSWSEELWRVEGAGSDSAFQEAILDISAYISDETRIRFQTGTGNNGNDRIYFDDIEICAAR